MSAVPESSTTYLDKSTAVAVDISAQTSYVDWPSIVAGATIAVATIILLLTFGSAIGLSVASPWTPGGPSAETIGIGAAIWFALVNIYAIGMGGYLAGRMRTPAHDSIRDEVQFRDGMNGLVVWAVTLVLGTLVATAAVSSAVSTAGSVASTAVAAGADAIGPVAERTLDATLRDSPVAATDPATDPSSTNTPETAAASTSTSNRQAELTSSQRSELLRIISGSLMRGELTSADRAYLERRVAQQTGVSPDVAKARVSSAVDSTLTTARQAAEKARKATALAGFLTAAVLLLAGLAAWWAGAIGGVHRDSAIFR